MINYPTIVKRGKVSLYLTRWIDVGEAKRKYAPDDVMYVIRYTALPVRDAFPFKLQMKAKYTKKQLQIAGYQLRLTDDDKYFHHMAETMEIPTNDTFVDVEEQEGEPVWIRYEGEPKPDKKTNTYETTWDYSYTPYYSTGTADTIVGTNTNRLYAENPIRTVTSDGTMRFRNAWTTADTAEVRPVRIEEIAAIPQVEDTNNIRLNWQQWLDEHAVWPRERIEQPDDTPDEQPEAQEVQAPRQNVMTQGAVGRFIEYLETEGGARVRVRQRR